MSIGKVWYFPPFSTPALPGFLFPRLSLNPESLTPPPFCYCRLFQGLTPGIFLPQPLSSYQKRPFFNKWLVYNNVIGMTFFAGVAWRDVIFCVVRGDLGGRREILSHEHAFARAFASTACGACSRPGAARIRHDREHLFISGRHDRGRVGICSLSGRLQSWRPLFFVLSAFYIFPVVFIHQSKKPLKYALFGLLASLPIISIFGRVKPAAAAAANKERLTRSRQQRRRFRVFPARYPTNKTIVKNI